jgi:chromosome segregation ATPase
VAQVTEVWKRASRNWPVWNRARPRWPAGLARPPHGAGKALSDARHELDQIAQQLRMFEEGRMSTERALQPQRDKIMEMQLKEQAARLNLEQFAAQLVEAQADEAALAEKLHPDMKASYLQGEVTRLTNAIAMLGAVNLAALDELATASERKNFLDAQNADLTEAIKRWKTRSPASTRKRAICCRTLSTASTATSRNCSRSCSAVARPS